MSVTVAEHLLSLSSKRYKCIEIAGIAGDKIIVVVQLQSCVQLFVTPWTAARQASLSITISWRLLKLCLLSW